MNTNARVGGRVEINVAFLVKMVLSRWWIVMLAAIGSVFGGNCSPARVKETGWVYKWKFTGKTTTGAKTQVKSSACSAGAACTVRCPASLRIEGYTWACSPGCGTEGFEMFSEVNEVFWHKKPYKASIAGGVITEVCNIIGKKAKNCEVGGTAKFTNFVGGSTPAGMYNFTYAGLGKYDKKHGRITSASGNFAGYAATPVYTTQCSVVPAGVWECGTLSLICDEKPTVVYGKWSVKYKKSASKKFVKSGKLPSYPTWVKPMNESGS
jgi:hypothetical protein